MTLTSDKPPWCFQAGRGGHEVNASSFLGPRLWQKGILDCLPRSATPEIRVCEKNLPLDGQPHAPGRAGDDPGGVL